MADKTAAGAPWQDLEQQAYHAFREWPIWLVLRERELAGRQPRARADQRAAGTADAAAGMERKLEPKGTSE